MVLLPSAARALVTITSLKGLIACAAIRLTQSIRHPSAKAGTSSGFLTRCLRESCGTVVSVSRPKISCTSSGLSRRSSIHSNRTIKTTASARPIRAPIAAFNVALGLIGEVGSSAGTTWTPPERRVFAKFARLWLISLASCVASAGSASCTSSSIFWVLDCGFTEIIPWSWANVSP